MLRIALGVIAGALPALAYRATLDNPLIFDDRTAILLNPSLASPWDLGAVLLHDRAHPLVNLSYAIDLAISGPSSFGYHVTNGILHLLVIGLLYGWCTRVLGSDRGQTGVRPGSDPGQTGVRPGSDRGQGRSRKLRTAPTT